MKTNVDTRIPISIAGQPLVRSRQGLCFVRVTSIFQLFWMRINLYVAAFVCIAFRSFQRMAFTFNESYDRNRLRPACSNALIATQKIISYVLKIHLVCVCVIYYRHGDTWQVIRTRIVGNGSWCACDEVHSPRWPIRNVLSVQKNSVLHRSQRSTKCIETLAHSPPLCA